MPKVLKRNNTKKNRRQNIKNKSFKKNTRGGNSSLRLNLPQGPNMDCGSPFHPQWGSKNASSKQLGLPKMNNFTFNQEGNLGFIQQGGHAWRNHVKKVMKNNPSLNFGQVLSIAKKSYTRENLQSQGQQSKRQQSKSQQSKRQQSKSQQSKKRL